VSPNFTRTLILFLNDSSIRNMDRFSNALHPYTDIHGHRPGLNKVRQRGVWGDITPQRRFGGQSPH